MEGVETVDFKALYWERSRWRYDYRCYDIGGCERQLLDYAWNLTLEKMEALIRSWPLLPEIKELFLKELRDLHPLKSFHYRLKDRTEYKLSISRDRVLMEE